MLFDHDLKRPGGFYNALEGRYTEDDKAQRKALERASPSATNAPRRNLVGFLNSEAQIGTSLEGIAEIRDKYQYNGGYRDAKQHNAAHERFAKSADFNRLHPGQPSPRLGLRFRSGAGARREPSGNAVRME